MIINKNSKRKGFTFIELLIASLIGVIVSSTAIDLIYSSSQSTELNTETSKMQQNGLFSSIFLVNDLYKAGDLDYGKSTFGREPFNWDKTGEFDSPNSQVSIRFYNHDNISNCSGDNTIGILENHYKVFENKLYCNEIEIIENVERFNLSYGLDLNGNGNIDRFVDRDNAKTLNESDSKRIIAVKFSLLLKSNKELGFSSKKDFTLVNGEKVEYNDKFAYRFFKRTVLLRNML